MNRSVRHPVTSDCEINPLGSPDPRRMNQTGLHQKESFSSIHGHNTLPGKLNLFSSLSRTRLFVLQAICFWMVLCLPGNIVTGVLYYRVNYHQEIPTAVDEPPWESPPLDVGNASWVNVARLSQLVEKVCHHLVELCLSSQSNAAISNCQAKLASHHDQRWLEDHLERVASLIGTLNGTRLNHFFPLFPDELLRCRDKPGSLGPNLSHVLECHEDKETYTPWVAWSKFWIEGVTVCVVGSFGLAGNIMTMLVLRNIKSNKNFNNLLSALSFFDFFLILDVMGEMSIIGVFMGKEPMWFKVLYPLFIHPIRGFIQTTAMYIVVAVSTERFNAVCYPLAPRHSYLKFVVVATLISFFIEAPRFLEFKLVANNTDYWTTDLMEDPDYIQFNSYWNDILATGLLPLVCLVYMNFKIYTNIRASSKFHKRFSTYQPRKPGERLTCQGVQELQTTRESMRGGQDRRTFRYSSKDTDHSSGSSFVSKMSMGKDTNATPAKKQLRGCPHRPEPERATAAKSSLHERETSFGAGSSPTKTNTTRAYIRVCRELVVKTQRKRKEKTTIVLVSIVLIFIVCHTYRLALRLYELAYPENNTLEHYSHCQSLGRYHVPVIFYVLANFHHLFSVVNSSVNFIIYCCVGMEFRMHVYELFTCKKP